ncbi:MAG: hypothetical protein CL834_06480 [Crocinitomicaceae bacterium]|nr:hypothetical protein [Crocinitomicaceae bacterium]
MAFNSAFSWFIRKRMYSIDLVRRQPVEVQRGLFNNLVMEGRRTSFGREAGFGSIRNWRDFKRIVPIRTYDELKPWIDRSKSGESNVLWPGATQWFAKSSGTSSNRSKFLPVTNDSLESCHYKGGKDLLALFCHQRPDAKLYGGKHLILGGSSSLDSMVTGSYTGDLSAIIVQNLPFWVEARRTPSREIAMMDNWEEKVDAMARATMREDVRILAGIPSWMLVVAKRVLDFSGANSLGEVWPNLQLFMHGGVSFAPYQAEFESLIGSTRFQFDYLETYNASEGFFGLQDRLSEDDMLLMLDYGIFFEFVPLTEWESENPIALELRELEVGVDYALVISTNAGLWRYALGDVIRITETHPFRMQVVGRTTSYLNAFGEEVMVAQADKAVAEASALTGAQVREYTAAPLFMRLDRTGGHQWIFEFAKEPQGGLELFLECLDASLKRQNSDYDAKRSGGLALQFPEGTIARVGTFENWLRSKGKSGGQHKIPRLSNSRDVVEEVLSISKAKFRADPV